MGATYRVLVASKPKGAMPCWQQRFSNESGNNFAAINMDVVLHGGQERRGPLLRYLRRADGGSRGRATVLRYTHYCCYRPLHMCSAQMMPAVVPSSVVWLPQHRAGAGRADASVGMAAKPLQM